MPMFNLLQYSQNYSMTSRSLWNYYRDEIDDVYNNTSDGKSFEYKTKIVGKTPALPENEEDINKSSVPILKVEVTVSLKYLNSFWRSLCHL